MRLMVPDSDAPASPTPPPPTTPSTPRAFERDEPAFEAAVLRAFVKDRRLVSIPARERKKLVVYRFLLDEVLPDPAEVVEERDLNMRLALWHQDVATLRRAFVEHGFVRREGMTFRRSVPARGAEG
jgi:hypothetical protein